MEKMTIGAAGYDLRSDKDYTIYNNQLSTQAVTVINFNISVAIPEGYVGLLTVRSSLAMEGLMLTNGVGIIDSDYRGELKGIFTSAGVSLITIDKGDRIAQLTVVKLCDSDVEINPTDVTVRGSGGLGSTGRK